MKKLASLLLLALLVSVAVPALADSLLYTNGPINGTVNASPINGGFQVSNSFTLSMLAEVESMSLGIWASSGQVPGTVQFGISASPFGSNLAGGTGTLSNQLLFTNASGFNVYDSSLTFPSFDLAAGDYWVTLSNARTTTGQSVGILWDQNNGPSRAILGSILGNQDVGSSSFSLLGDCPEPGTLSLLGTGMLAVGSLLRRKLLLARA